MWTSIGQSVMVSGIVYVFVVHDWSCAAEFENYGSPNIGQLIISESETAILEYWDPRMDANLVLTDFRCVCTLSPG